MMLPVSGAPKSSRSVGRALALAATLLAALALVACGGDEEETDTSSSGSTDSTVAVEETTETEETTAPSDDAAATGAATSKDVVSCLEDLDHDVIVNPGSIGGAENFLVVDAGFGSPVPAATSSRSGTS